MKSWLAFFKMISACTLCFYCSHSINALANATKASTSCNFFLKFDYGLIGVFYHQVKWGKSDFTSFDYVKDGGQDLLFPTWRIELGVTRTNHKLTLLYQPIFLETETVIETELMVDGDLFPKEYTKFTYDFPFYRLSYWYLVSASDSLKLWAGGGIQIRNANIKFRNYTSNIAFRESSLGPVPLINLLIENHFSEKAKLVTALTGFWADVKYINGGSTDVKGWIYELEVQPWYSFEDNWQGFAGFRLLGGGAEGNSNKKRQGEYTYTKDVLGTLSFTVGLSKTL